MSSEEWNNGRTASRGRGNGYWGGQQRGRGSSNNRRGRDRGARGGMGAKRNYGNAGFRTEFTNNDFNEETGPSSKRMNSEDDNMIKNMTEAIGKLNKDIEELRLEKEELKLQVSGFCIKEQEFYLKEEFDIKVQVFDQKEQRYKQVLSNAKNKIQAVEAEKKMLQDEVINIRSENENLKIRNEQCCGEMAELKKVLESKEKEIVSRTESVIQLKRIGRNYREKAEETGRREAISKKEVIMWSLRVHSQTSL